jgi:ATP-dependent phosphofructokinase / diphosphate-dependent phosphofructokinase
VLATRYGVYAVEMVIAEKWGRMAALSGNRILDVSLEEAVADFKYLSPEIYATAATLFG